MTDIKEALEALQFTLEVNLDMVNLALYKIETKYPQLSKEDVTGVPSSILTMYTDLLESKAQIPYGIKLAKLSRGMPEP